MRTIFQTGFAPAREPWSLVGPRMGQPVEDMEHFATFMEEDRNKLLNTISAAVNKAKVLDDFIAAHADKDPHLVQVLGADQTRFWALSNSIAPLYPTVKQEMEWLSDPDPEFWFQPTDQEAQDIHTWVVGVTEMFKIYQRHKPAPERKDEKPPEPPMILGIPQEQFIAGAAAAAGVGVLLLVIGA